MDATHGDPQLFHLLRGHWPRWVWSLGSSVWGLLCSLCSGLGMITPTLRCSSGPWAWPSLCRLWSQGLSLGLCGPHCRSMDAGTPLCQDSGLSGCPAHQGQNRRGALGALGESKSQSQSRDLLAPNQPWIVPHPAQRVQHPSEMRRCRGKLSKVRTLTRLPLPAHPVAMQTRPHVPVYWPLVFISMLRTSPNPSAFVALSRSVDPLLPTSSLGVRAASPPREPPPASTP